MAATLGGQESAARGKNVGVGVPDGVATRRAPARTLAHVVRLSLAWPDARLSGEASPDVCAFPSVSMQGPVVGGYTHTHKHTHLPRM